MVTLEYEVNGGGLQTLEPITGTEDIDPFVGFTEGSNGGTYPTHGYGQQYEFTIFLYHNTVADRYTLFFQGGYEYDENDGLGAKCNFTETITTADYVIGNSFQAQETDYFDSAWGVNPNSDDESSQSFCGGIKANAFFDCEFTLSQSDHTFSSGADPRLPDDFQIITQDGGTPTGGNVVSAGTSGTIRLKFQNLPSYSGGGASKGDRVVLLKEDLAHA